MPRPLNITRDEAELLTDLLMLTDNYPALSEEIRKQWGMCSREEELAKRGKTLAMVRHEWAIHILTSD